MKNKSTFLLLLFSILSNAQFPTLSFNYDTAGNQTTRVYCPNCSTVAGKQNLNSKDIKENDLVQFFPNDILSYYPNPVKEELYLKWKIIDDNNVVSLIIYNVNGAVVKKIETQSKQDNTVISFYEFPQGLYLVELNYNDEKKETIKIIKN